MGRLLTSLYLLTLSGIIRAIGRVDIAVRRWRRRWDG
jgi:hypothetical protein